MTAGERPEVEAVELLRELLRLRGLKIALDAGWVTGVAAQQMRLDYALNEPTAWRRVTSIVGYVNPFAGSTGEDS